MYLFENQCDNIPYFYVTETRYTEKTVNSYIGNGKP
jgi:hypothetical protein